MGYNETYRTDPKEALLGMISNQTNAQVIVSRTAEEAIPFGVALARGTRTQSVRNVATGDTEILGISVRVQGVDAESFNAYPVNENVTVLRKGPIWVTAGENVAEGDPVSVTVNGGAFGTGAAAGKIEIPEATYESAAVAGELVRVHIL